MFTQPCFAQRGRQLLTVQLADADIVLIGLQRESLHTGFFFIAALEFDHLPEIVGRVCRREGIPVRNLPRLEERVERLVKGLHPNL